MLNSDKRRAAITLALLAAVWSQGCGGGNNTLQSIQITPNPVAFNSVIGLERAIQLQAEGKFDDGSKRDITALVQFTAPPDRVTITSGGLITAFAVSSCPWDTQITASQGAISGTVPASCR